MQRYICKDAFRKKGWIYGNEEENGDYGRGC